MSTFQPSSADSFGTVESTATMAQGRRGSKRLARATYEEQLAAFEARAAALRPIVKAQGQFSAQAVRQHRHRLAITATQYGELLGVSMQTVYGWEKGRNTPRPDLLLRWVALTGKPDRVALQPLDLEVVKPITARELRAQRKRLGLNQARYAALVGVHSAAISAWEAGKKPGRAGLEKLQAAWGVGKVAAQRRVARRDLGPAGADRRKRRKASLQSKPRFPKHEHRLSYHPERALAALEKRAAALRILIKAGSQFSPTAVRRHRQGLGLSATRYGELLGVHMQCVYGWEKGRFCPRPELLHRWVALTRMSKKQICARLWPP